MIRLWRGLAVAAALFCVSILAMPALANFVAKDGNSALQTMCSVTNGGVQTPCSVTPDGLVTGASLNSATLNAVYTVTLGQGQGVVGFAVSGLTASGATLTVEGSNNGGATWSAINKVDGGTGVLATAITVDGQFRVNAGGRTGVRLRVSIIGTGTITISSNASVASSETTLTTPLPPGSNNVGKITPQIGGADVGASNPLPALPPQAAVTETTVNMTGLWVKVWTAAAAKRLIIGLPSDSGASGDYSFNASLSGLSTSGGVPFAAGNGGSFDFAGGAVPNTDLYVKATPGSRVTVQVFN